MITALFIVLFLAGLFLVIKGSDWFIDSAVWAAEVFRIPPLIIGATVISICTTVPETFVSATAAALGQPAMAMGNALGSIGVNLGLILAVLLIFTKPVIENRREFLQSSVFLFALLILLIFTGVVLSQIGKITGVVLILLFILYIVHNFSSAKKLMDLDIIYDIVDDEMTLNHQDSHRSLPDGVVYDEDENDFDVSVQVLTTKIVFFALGAGCVLLGSNLLIGSAVHIAEIFHVPTMMIAVIFTSLGTALPELITLIASIRKEASNLGLGNVLGASILNILQAVGISALLSPVPLEGEKSILLFQLPFLAMMALSIILFGLFHKRELPKRSGYWLLVLYFIYITVNLLRENLPLVGPLIFGA